MENADMVVAVRFMATTVMAGVAIMALHAAIIMRRGLLQDQWPWFTAYKQIIAIGIALLCFGWSLQQQYFLLWQVSRQDLRDDMTTSPIVLVPYAIVALGSALVASGWLSTMVGRWWPAVAAVVIGVLLIIGGVGAHTQ